MKTPRPKIANGDRVSPTMPGFKAWTKHDPANDDHCHGELRPVPADARGIVLKRYGQKALIHWQLPIPIYGWIEAQYLTHEAHQSEMRIDGGFALLRESAEDGARVAKERATARERAEQAERAQLQLF